MLFRFIKSIVRRKKSTVLEDYERGQTQSEPDPFGLNEQVRKLASAMHEVDAQIAEKVEAPTRLVELTRDGLRPLDESLVKYRLADPRPFVLRMDASHNHARAHIHLDHGRDRHIASYAIDTGEPLAGTEKYDKPVKKWIDQNRVLLAEIWRLTRDGPQPEALIAQIRTRPFF